MSNAIGYAFGSESEIMWQRLALSRYGCDMVYKDLGDSTRELGLMADNHVPGDVVFIVSKGSLDRKRERLIGLMQREGTIGEVAYLDEELGEDGLMTLAPTMPM